MTFGDLQSGDHFVLPNHFETFNGRPDVRMTNTLEVFRKIEPRGAVNAAEWKQDDTVADCEFTDMASVIKLVSGSMSTRKQETQPTLEDDMHAEAGTNP